MKPNIIFLHSHNTGRFIQPYGHAVPTPHMQQLAQEGAMFHNAFSPSPTCSPGRSGFLTGRHPHCNGMLGLAHLGWGLNNREHHIGRYLSKNGYQSVLCGVEHLEPHVNPRSHSPSYDRCLTNSDKNAWHDRLLPEVTGFLDEKPEGPFFLSVGLQETHLPFPEADPEKYPEQDERYCTPPRPFPNTPRMRRNTAEFKHAARKMDDTWGAILASLKENGLADNTYVFCFTDHGLQWPLHIGNVGEHGNAVYLLARGPEHFTGGKALQPMVSLMDLYPTVCDLAGIEKPDWLQGKSLLPLVDGETDRQYDELYFEQTFHAAYEPERAVRTERCIYIRRYDDRTRPVFVNTDTTLAKIDMVDAGWEHQPRYQERLYDLYFDPDMRNNIAHHKEMRDTLGMMRRKLERWMEETDDPLRHGEVRPPKGHKTFDIESFSCEDGKMIVAE